MNLATPTRMPPTRGSVQESGYRARNCHFALIKVGIVILFDTVEVIEVVDHHPDRLLQAFVAQIRRPVDGMQAGAIT